MRWWCVVLLLVGCIASAFAQQTPSAPRFSRVSRVAAVNLAPAALAMTSVEMDAWALAMLLLNVARIQSGTLDVH
ncbi:hypothetical protein BDV11DRAFT_154957 [Aspergillus similis]